MRPAIRTLVQMRAWPLCYEVARFQTSLIRDRSLAAPGWSESEGCVTDRTGESSGVIGGRREGGGKSTAGAFLEWSRQAARA